MIQHKTGKCIDCQPDKPDQPLIAGRCQSHYWQYRNKVAAEKNKSIKSVADRIVAGMSKEEREEFLDGYEQQQTQKKANATVSIKRKAPIKRSPIQKNTGTKLWMEYHIAEANVHGWRCENCGSHIDGYNEEAAYGAQAHILPKNHFPSVKNHLENHMLLNRFSCACHGQFDSSWLNASKMPIFRKAWHIVNDKLIHLLSPEELRRLPEVFIKPLPNQ